VTSGPNDTPLTRLAGITEPATVLTNVALSLVAFVLAAQLGLQAALEGTRSAASIAGAFMATGVAAAFGAVAHGIDPLREPELRARIWRGALYTTGFGGVGAIASAAFFAARGGARVLLLGFALIKLVIYLISAIRKPEFRLAVIDYGVALTVLLVGAVYGLLRWHEPGATWIIGGVAVSLVAGLVQGLRVSPHRWFNHNDLFHVIQIVALYLFFRGGALLVDR
jgi:hypothetical protein